MTNLGILQKAMLKLWNSKEIQFSICVATVATHFSIIVE